MKTSEIKALEALRDRDPEKFKRTVDDHRRAVAFEMLTNVLLDHYTNCDEWLADTERVVVTIPLSVKALEALAPKDGDACDRCEVYKSNLCPGFRDAEEVLSLALEIAVLDANSYRAQEGMLNALQQVLTPKMQKTVSHTR